MASIIKSIEYVELTWDNASDGSVDLTQGQDETQCIPRFSWQATGALDDDFRERMHAIDIYDNEGTAAVRVIHTGAADTDDRITGVFIYEFVAGINVQKAATSLADSVASDDIAITDVTDQDSALWVHTYDYDHTVAMDAPDSAAIRSLWNGAATASITIQRNNNNGAIAGWLYIADCDLGEFIANHHEITMAATDESQTATIGSIIPADTFILSDYETSEGGDDPLDGSIVTDLQNATTTRSRRSIAGASDAAATISVQAVTCQNNEWAVQRADETMNNAGEVADINEVILANSIVQAGCPVNNVYALGTSDLTSGNAVEDLAVKLSFNSNVEIAFDRRLNTETGNIIPWEAIDFTGAVDAQIFLPASHSTVMVRV